MLWTQLATATATDGRWDARPLSQFAHVQVQSTCTLRCKTHMGINATANLILHRYLVRTRITTHNATHCTVHRPLEVLEPRNALYLFNVFDFSIFEFNLIYMHHLSTVSTKSVVWSAVASDSFTPVGRHHSFPNSLVVNELCRKPTLWTACAAFAVDRRPWNIFATLQLWKTTTELDTS